MAGVGRGMKLDVKALMIPFLVGLGLVSGLIREVFLAYLFGTSCAMRDTPEPRCRGFSLIPDRFAISMNSIGLTHIY